MDVTYSSAIKNIMEIMDVTYSGTRKNVPEKSDRNKSMWEEYDFDFYKPGEAFPIYTMR